MSVNTTVTPQSVSGSGVTPKLGYFRGRSLLLTGSLALITIIFLYPFISLIAWSLNRIDSFMNPLIPWPQEFSFKLYQLAFTEYGFQNYVLNTIFVVLTSTFLGTIASALSGYALAKLEFPGRRLLFLLILGVMLLPTETMLVPQFVVVRDLGLINTYWALILPAIGGGAFSIFLMRQFMLQLPTEMLEAGRMDGCSEFGLFLRIALPVMKAPILVLATLSIRGGWNSLLWPQIVLTDEAKQLIMPAIVRLNQLIAADAYARPVAVSAAIVSALVPLVFYIYTQRHFVSALAGSMKG
ncbi:carbohydrate ABC transporter permease [Chloroflexi bacterium TSY]|nr:carbohydrate ABC transporter permease [Chloroflexi bacterium TSY]